MLLLFAACSSTDEQSGPLILPTGETAEGNWVVPCQIIGAGSELEVTLISGNTFTNTLQQFLNNTTCDGTPSQSEVATATIALGATADALLGLGGPSVTATKVDLILADETAKTLFYIDEAAEPDLFYFGAQPDEPGAPPLDSEGYPTVLNTNDVGERQ